MSGTYGSGDRTAWRWIWSVVALVVAMVVAAPTSSAAQQGSSILINEIHYNPDGQVESWEFVELHNAGAAPVDVSGYAFTRGVEYLIPDGTTIDAGAFLVITRDLDAFAGEFGQAADGEFSGALSNGGETLTLRDAADAVVDEVTWDDATPWPVSADGDGASLQVLDPTLDNDAATSWGAGDPTPGAANAVDLDVIASVTRGWYAGGLSVTLSSTIPGAQINYATGAGALNQVASGPITVTDNGAVQVIRAQAVLGNDASRVISHTYVFQPDRGIPVVASWPNPVGAADGETETTITFEFLPPPSTGLAPAFGWAGTRTSAGGAAAGSSDKVYFRGDYGNGTLAGDLFGDFHYGIEPANEFDQLFLRDEHSDYTHMRQIMAHDALLSLGSLSPHGRYVEYFVSGADEGIRHLQERPEAGFMEAYTGVDKDEWLAWSRNENGLGRSTMGAPYANWAEATQIVNVEQLIDFSLVQWQANAEDFRSVKNFRTAGPNDPTLGDGDQYRYHYFNWDMDIGYNHNFYNRGAPDLWAWSDFVTPDYVAHEMDHFDEFGFLASDRIACAFFGDGPLTSSAWSERLEARRAELVLAGGEDEAAYVATMETWLAARNTWLISQFRQDQHTDNIYNAPQLDKPPWKPPSPFEGPLLSESDPVHISLANDQLVITGEQGRAIHYRLDGGDPRTADGQLSPDALLYTGPVDLPSGQHLLIARGFDSSQANIRDRWTPACNEPQTIDVAAAPGSVVINELHYNPLPVGAAGDANHVDGDRFEFIELHNPTGAAVGIGGFTFTDGVEFQIPLGESIASGGYYLVASDAERFAERFGFAPDGDYSGNLSDSGEMVVLSDASGSVVDTVEFDDSEPWPLTPDAGGPSLSLVEPGLDNAAVASWKASSAIDGSPGQPNLTLDPGDVDGSLVVDADDVRAVLRQRAGLSPDPFIAVVADANRDGTINLLDALLIAQLLS